VPAWKWRVGLTLYDCLAGRSNLRRHRPLDRRWLHHEFPGLRTQELEGGAEYHDAQMDDARLCLEVVRTAALQGASVANYVEAIRFERSSGEIGGVRAVDRVAGRELVIHARQVLNATGPWVDAICRLAGDAGGPYLRPTKGVHVLAPDRGLTAAFLLLHPRDGRVFFVIPWMGKTLIGTTDTLSEEAPESLQATSADVAYLLEAYNHHFVSSLAAGELLGSFAGLRPLLRSRPGEPSSLSREFHVFASPSGLLSVAGGKYTTYRHMAEVITDRAMARLGRRRRVRTRDFRLDGAPATEWQEFFKRETWTLSARNKLTLEAAEHLIRRYGQRASTVATYLARDPALARPVVPEEPDLWGEFAYQRDQEMAIYPADHLLRRTRLGLFHPELLRPSPPGLLAAANPSW
jgi:glycerol-3-phosphate dehydrogenase